MKLCYNGDAVIEKHGNTNVHTWSNKADIKTYLKPLRKSKDPKMPDDREGLIQRFNSWKHRSRKDLTMDRVVLDEFEKWRNIEEEKNRGKLSRKK